MRHWFLALLATPLLITANSLTAQPGVPELELLWTLQGLASPESIQLSDSKDFLYVSNVNGEGGERDGNGYIATVALNGELLERSWVTGLDAPKGLALQNGLLYVSDIDHLVIIDTKTAAIKHRIQAPGAGFLNDVVIDTAGHVLVSDSANSAIYRLNDDDQLDIWFQDEQLAGINGLYAQGEQLLITTMSRGELLSLHTPTQRLQRLAGGMDNADGITPLPGGGYLVSAWPGQLFYVDADGAEKVLLDTQAETIYMNDFMLLGDILLVPNWQPGSLHAYRVNF